MDRVDYDEFSMFHENLSEWHLEVPVPPVRRLFVAVDGLRQLSALRWGEEPPELVLVHGVAQNAHTFDTVALALQRPLLALDLPGHGHSDASRAPYGAFDALARDLEVALDQLTDRPLPLVGMSLGGLCSIVVADERPDLVAQLVLVDITPGVTHDKARHVTDFVAGPASFDSFEEILARTVAYNPTRSVSSLRRGVLHNALQRPDGSWVWRHQRFAPGDAADVPAPSELWDRLGRLTMPVALIRALGPGSVVDLADVAELRRRVPAATVVGVEGAGHSIQGDQPLQLAELIERICF